MLGIHILNVGHGDSIVLEYEKSGNKAFAVIDSNVSNDQIAHPKALLKLQELNAGRLEFIAITHPHADHYMGMRAIMETYAGNIDNFYTFPINRSSEKLKLIANAFLDAAEKGADSPTLTYRASEFVSILKAAKAIPHWESPSGNMNYLSAPNFDEVEIWEILPPARVEQDFYDEIKNGKLKLESSDQNDLSMAFLLRYKGHEIVLGGDGSYKNWTYQTKRWNPNQRPKPIAAKLPHHGSRKDSNKTVLDIIYGAQAITNSVGCISAEGGSDHPHNEVIDDLVRRGIKPYCTNLAKRCGANNQALISDPSLDRSVEPLLARFINSVTNGSSVKQPQACQGNIVLRISDAGDFSVETEHKNLCQFRGDLSFLSGALH